ncbi:tyrosinase family oxidase copper chaperone [Streptomyces sp. NPDC101110]|uniref:tyrosinase family oxidase copper chaperone n=1 Tax=unclassified Streptomyces TaxID=2593676 RepID=UPI00381601FF
MKSSSAPARPASSPDCATPPAGGWFASVANARFRNRRWLLASLLASATGAVIAPVFSKRESAASVWAERFNETYKGRRIVGGSYPTSAGSESNLVRWHVTVDGEALHLMRRADGSWMTMIDHYQSYPTPLAAARAAVDELAPGTKLGGSWDGGGDADESRGASAGTKFREDHPHGLHT